MVEGAQARLPDTTQDDGGRRLRLLIVAFYFPPAGGGGVQRPLQLAKHLRDSGVDVHVLAPDDPRWIHRDELLEIPRDVTVWRARNFGPRGRKPAEELYDLVGTRRLLHRAALFPRRLLMPDENVPCVLSAIPAAVGIVRREQIDIVMTTSPPSSIHLVGAGVKALTGVRWIADLRDSIAAKPDLRFDRRAVRLKELSHRRIATLVARQADRVVAVTETIGAEISAINPAARVTVIPNGIDQDEFADLRYTPGESFRLTHTGSFFGRRDPRPTLEAIGRAGGSIQARFIGDFRKADRNWLAASGLDAQVELIPFVTHRRSLELQRDSEALLLLLPDGAVIATSPPGRSTSTLPQSARSWPQCRRTEAPPG